VKIGLYTGSFDPLTFGHLDIIRRASQLFDKLYVGIFENERKHPLFSLAERQKMLVQLLLEYKDIEVIVHMAELTVNVAQELGVTALVRSVRSATDLVYESEMVYFNEQMTGVETVLLVAKPELQYLNSTRLKELAKFGVDISKWVPESIKIELEKKFA
jgi:pantetheine-phosphate adenylyltransferase